MFIGVGKKFGKDECLKLLLRMSGVITRTREGSGYRATSLKALRSEKEREKERDREMERERERERAFSPLLNWRRQWPSRAKLSSH